MLWTFNDTEMIMTLCSLVFSFLNPKSTSFNSRNGVKEKLLTYVHWKYTALTWPLHLCRHKGKQRGYLQVKSLEDVSVYIYRYQKIQDPFSTFSVLSQIKSWLLCKTFYCDLTDCSSYHGLRVYVFLAKLWLIFCCSKLYLLKIRYLNLTF